MISISMEKFIAHYKNVEGEAKNKLNSFEKNKELSHRELLEEMAFCLFAANSSAKMGIKACELIREHLDSDLETLRGKVHKKVRFYNKRIEYYHYNREYIESNHEDFEKFLKKFESPLGLRAYINSNLKGFGMKESSHLLRNLGYRGFAIIDKHVLSVTDEVFGVKLEKPRNEKEYLLAESRLKEIALAHGFDFDVLDLAMWSYRTGEIIK